MKAKLSKTKKRVIALMLATALATTASAKQEEEKIYRKKAYARVEDIIDSRDFYSISRAGETYEEMFSPFYQAYLDNFLKYLDEKQCNSFLNIVRTMDEDECYDFKDTFRNLDMIMGCNDVSYGRGIYRAFNTRLVYEGIFPAYRFRSSTYRSINTLRSIVNNDKEFFSSLFSKDIEKFIDCIITYTGFDNRDLVEELVLKMDLYSDLAYSEDINEVALRETYEKRIKEIMKMIVSAKLENDEEFSNTLYGKILKKGEYCEGAILNAYQEIMGDNFEFVNYNEHASYSINIPSQYLYSDADVADVKNYKVNEIISKASSDDESSFYKDGMDLMILLVNPEIFDKAEDDYAESRRNFMYEDLKEYFNDIEEFDDFFLSVTSGSVTFLDRYFTLIKEVIEEDGITHEDFLRYTALRNLSNERESVFYDWALSVDYPPFEEIKAMDEDSASKIVPSTTYSYLFDGIDYNTYFDIIEHNLKDNDLGYEMIYSPECEYRYYYGKIRVLEDSTSVVSPLIKPQLGNYNGTSVIYYEIPENYENGRAVDVFINIERKLTTRQVEGIKDEFYDSIKGKTVNGFIVEVNASNEDLDNYAPIRFIEYYKYFTEKQENNKSLTLGDAQ